MNALKSRATALDVGSVTSEGVCCDGRYEALEPGAAPTVAAEPAPEDVALPEDDEPEAAGADDPDPAGFPAAPPPCPCCGLDPGEEARLSVGSAPPGDGVLTPGGAAGAFACSGRFGGDGRLGAPGEGVETGGGGGGSFGADGVDTGAGGAGGAFGGAGVETGGGGAGGSGTDGVDTGGLGTDGVGTGGIQCPLTRQQSTKEDLPWVQPRTNN